MKKRFRTAGVGLVTIAVLGFAAYVRLAPSDPGVWNTPPAVYGWDHGAPFDRVIPLSGGASLRLSTAQGDPAALLQRLDTIAMATPRTRQLAATDNRITWITRSALWGFPDYTTAEVRPDGLYIFARLRFGSSDLGVNAARLNDWLSLL